MEPSNLQIALALAVLGVANIGAIIGAYLSLRDSKVRSEVLVDTLRKDMNGVGAKLRNIETELYKRRILK